MDMVCTNCGRPVREAERLEILLNPMATILELAKYPLAWYADTEPQDRAIYIHEGTAEGCSFYTTPNYHHKSSYGENPE